MTTAFFELPFFVNLLILLVTARLFGELFEHFKQPAMIGEILAGIVLGPTIFNLIHRTSEIQVVSDLGIFLLIIIAGLEVNIDEILKSAKGKNLVISISAFFLPIFSGFAVGYFFGVEAMTAVFIGLCVAITALPVSVRILMDLGKLNSSTGQKIISVAIFDDVLALTILGVILNVKDSDMSFASVSLQALISLAKLLLFIAIISCSYILIKKISKRDNYIENKIDKLLLLLKGKELLFSLFFIFILIFATVTELLGFHFIVGAFFGAMLLSEKVVGKKHLDSIHNTTNGLAMGFLSPIFFAGIGLEFNISSIHNWWFLLAILGISYFSKIAGGFLGSKIAGLSNRVSFTIGIGLNARGIMELVIANIAYQAGMISLEIFSMLVIMGVLTTLTTPVALKRFFYEK
ncbi:MAG: cation:proton antiporter [Bacteroidetes bacterium]|nr:cation:proton antiporter [Bacteroidota bacterium]